MFPEKPPKRRVPEIIAEIKQEMDARTKPRKPRGILSS
jgi:hypothetical protein